MLLKRIAINGFGRIGRSFVRAALLRKELGRDFEIVAINDLADIQNLAYLLKYDSVQHRLKQELAVKGNKMIVDGHEIEILSVADPVKLPWRQRGIDIVVESTGLFTKKAKAKAHLDAGAKRVVISAPSPDADISIVIGVNHKKYDPSKHFVISNASCTTNSLAPPVKVLHESFGIETGLMTTVHAYTQNQRILDFPDQKDWRRGRAGALSIIPTTSGAAEAIAQVFPELTGKITGAALRVPVPDGSVTDFTAVLKREVTRAEVNEALKKASEGSLKGIMGYTDDPIVSADIICDPHSAVIDGQSTLVIPEPGRMVKILSWYDNEYGYANRLIDLVSNIL
ncbi:MAG: type I glyceraldehyde-3-phosphate dehydrogenase [Thermoplasmata archaeon]